METAQIKRRLTWYGMQRNEDKEDTCSVYNMINDDTLVCKNCPYAVYFGGIYNCSQYTSFVYDVR